MCEERGSASTTDCMNNIRNHVILGWRLCRNAGPREAFKNGRKKKQPNQTGKFTCREMSAFGFHLLLGGRRHACSDVQSAAGRNRTVQTKQISALFCLKTVHYSSVCIVNVAFSWALFRNDAWWRHVEPCKSAVTYSRTRLYKKQTKKRKTEAPVWKKDFFLHLIKKTTCKKIIK